MIFKVDFQILDFFIFCIFYIFDFLPILFIFHVYDFFPERGPGVLADFLKSLKSFKLFGSFGSGVVFFHFWGFFHFFLIL